MRNNRRVSLTEIAKEAGVSAQTVSRVVNGHANVATETREKIQAIIDRRGYHPSHFARSLLQGRSNTIGVVTHGLGLFGPSQTLAGIVQEANRQGYSILPTMLNTPEAEDPNEIIGQLLEYHVDGIIWAISQIGDNLSWTAELPPLDVPIFFTTMEKNEAINIAHIDNRVGGHMAAQHLIGRGCHNIGIIQGNWAWWEARERAIGWRMAMEENGLPINEDWVLQGDWSAATGEKMMRHLLEHHPEIDGLFISNDTMALGALKVAHERNLRIPEDIAIIGFDDTPEAAHFYPPLTTIRQNLDELGCWTVAALNTLINTTKQSPHPKHVVLKPELIIRESS